MTTNDLETNELLVRISYLHPIVSERVRAGLLGSALHTHADLEVAVRELGWRLLRLNDERGKP